MAILHAVGCQILIQSQFPFFWFQSQVCHAVKVLTKQFLQNNELGPVNFFVIMKELVSSHNPSHDMCLETLFHMLPNICSYHENFFSNHRDLSTDKQKREDYVFMYVYFSFWQKIFKKCVHTDECAKLFFSQAWVFNLFSAQTEILLIKKFLNLLNSLFCYGRSIFNLKDLDPIYVKISDRMMCLEKKLSCVELRSGHIGFGGIQNTLSQLYTREHTRFGVDATFLRSLTLLFVKLFAIELGCLYGE